MELHTGGDPVTLIGAPRQAERHVLDEFSSGGARGVASGAPSGGGRPVWGERGGPAAGPWARWRPGVMLAGGCDMLLGPPVC